MFVNILFRYKCTTHHPQIILVILDITIYIFVNFSIGKKCLLVNNFVLVINV